jgi:hypothetical protein
MGSQLRRKAPSGMMAPRLIDDNYTTYFWLLTLAVLGAYFIRALNDEHTAFLES